jgi:hypothetical protein
MKNDEPPAILKDALDDPGNGPHNPDAVAL